MSLMIFLLSVGEGLTAPAIPLLGKSWGAGYWELGLLMTGYGVAYTVMTLVAGHISDSLGRKLMLAISLGLTIVAAIGYMVAASILALLIFRTIEGMSRGILWPVAEAAIADNANPSNPGRATGMFTTAYGLGVTLGTLSGGTMMAKQGFAVFSYYPVMGIIALVAIAVGFINRPLSGESGFSVNSSKNNKLPVLKALWPIGVIGFAYGGFLYSIWALLSALASEFNVSVTGIGLLFGCFWGLRTICFLASQFSISSWGSKLTLLLGILLCTLGAGSLIFADNFSLLLLSSVLSGIGTGLLFPSILVLVMERTGLENRGFGMGFLELLIGLGMIGQTAASGFLGQWGGPGWIYVSNFAANFIALIVGAFIFWSMKLNRSFIGKSIS